MLKKLNPESETSPEEKNIRKLLAEIEKINAQINAEKEIRTALNDKILHLSEEIGDLRRAIIEKEKKISEIDIKATKSSDLVKEVKPEKFFEELKKEQAKIEAMKVKIETNKKMMDKILEDLKKIRSKMNLYRGSEEVLKLYSDIKDDIRTLNKLKARVENNADRVESMFIEMEKKIKDQSTLMEDIEDIRKTLREIEKKVDKNSLEIKSKAGKNEIRTLISSIKGNTLAKLFRKNEQISDLKAVLESFKEDKSLAEKINEIQETVQTKLKEIKETETKIKNYLSEKDENSQKINSEINKLKEDINEKNKELALMNSLLDKLYSQQLGLKHELNEIREKVINNKSIEKPLQPNTLTKKEDSKIIKIVGTIIYISIALISIKILNTLIILLK